MEALTRKNEKEKLAELEAMLADATLSGDVTDASSVSFASEAPTPPRRHRALPSAGHDFLASSRLAWRPADWHRSSDVDNHDDLDNSFPSGGHEVDVTARIYSTCSTESSADEATRRRVDVKRVRRHDSGRFAAADEHNSRNRRRAERDEEMTLVRSQLSAALSQLEQKEVVTRSLQRQLDQRGEIEAQIQARAEEDLVAALAKVSGLKEELARTSQLLVDGALERQHLEQRCSLLAQDLHKSGARTAELETQVSESRAELVRVSGALHARRGTDVVDAERAFGEELQRVQESATHEARALRQEASAVRVSLEQTRAKLRKACEERDAWREELEVLSSEASTLRETVGALRQFRENETIDQLLGQVSRWKRRAEELEQLQRVSSPEGPASFDSTSERNANFGGGSVEPPSPIVERLRGAASLSAAGPAVPLLGNQGVAVEGLQASNEALREELSEAKESLLMAGEEVAAAVLAARGQAVKVDAAEARVKSLEREVEARNRAARESLLARRAAKVKALADLKIAIQQEMGAGLDRLRSELGEYRHEEKPGTEEEPACQRSDSYGKELRVDKSCQVDREVGSCLDEKTREDQIKVVPTCSTCESDLGDRILDEISMVASSTVVVKEESERRIAAAVAAAVAAEGEATAWAHAFSSAKQLVEAALVSLCDHATSVLGAQRDGWHKFAVPLLKEGEAAGCIDPSVEGSSAVIPWVSGEANAQAATELDVLRDSVESAVEGIRVALAAHAARVVVVAPLSTAQVVSWTTTGVQTEKETKDEQNGRGGQALAGELCRIRQRAIGVQVGGHGRARAQRASSAREADGAPAWEVGSIGRCSLGQSGGEKQDRRWQLEDDALVEELKRKADALSEALQRAEVEKGDLERSLTRDLEREKAIGLERQQAMYESQISELHACTMAIVRDFGGNSPA